MVKKILSVILVVILVVLAITIALLFTGRATASYRRFSSPTFKEFKKNIMKEHDKIEKITAEYWTPDLSITYTLKDDATDKDIDDILKKTEQLINDEEFKKEFLETYFGRYKGNTYVPMDNGMVARIIYYPSIRVEFSRGDRGVRVVEYKTESPKYIPYYENWEYEYQGEADYYKSTDDIVDIPIQ
jgi:hypothetical protein